MDALKHAVAAAFDKVVESGAIETAIQEQISKVVTSAISDQIGGYNSDFKKAVNDKIKTMIDVNLDQIDLPSYRQLIGDIIKKRVGAVMTSEFTEKLDKDISELLEPAPAEITLEKLLEEYVDSKKEAYNYNSLRGEKFTLRIDRSSNVDGYFDICLDEESHTDRHSCDIRINVRGPGEIWGLDISGNEIKNKLFVGKLYNFEKRLFQMFTAKTLLIVPPDATEDDYETRFPDGYDD